MTADKLKDTLLFYRTYICAFFNVAPQRADEPTPSNCMAHLAGLCDVAITDLLFKGKTEKAMRWLGFVQGVLFARGLFTLSELKSHSRPSPAK